MEKYLKIPQATIEGFALCKEGGVFDWRYPDSTTRRGRVIEDGDICPTLICEPQIYYIEKI